MRLTPVGQYIDELGQKQFETLRVARSTAGL
jgi:hypothetical protein